MTATRLLVLLVLTIFLGEFAIMFGLHVLALENEVIENLVDATSLVIIVFPFLYFLVFRALSRKNQELVQAQARLSAANEGLEHRIKERTNEVAEANRELQQTIGRLHRRHAQMTQLAELINFFQSCRDIDEALSLSQSQWLAIFSDQPGALYLMKPSRNVLERTATWGQPTGMRSHHGPDDCWALRRGKPHLNGGAEGLVRCAHIAPSDHQHYLCLPMRAHSDTLGLICLQVPPGSVDTGEAPKGDDATFQVAAVESLGLAFSNLRLRETLRYQATRDALTGLFNRRYMLESLEREILRGQSRGQRLALAMLDIDHFKRLNDLFGHGAGDAALCRVSEVIREWGRGEDIIARYGGEEFAVVMPDTSADLAFERLEALRKAVERAVIDYHGRNLPTITISCGIATYPTDRNTQDDLIKLADEVLYEAKAAGRNQVRISCETANLIPAEDSAASLRVVGASTHPAVITRPKERVTQ